MKPSTAMHIKTMKMFGIVTTIFLASFIPGLFLFLGLTNRFHITYFIFFNHNTHFIVYIAYNAKFRRDFWEHKKSIFYCLFKDRHI